MLKLHVRVAGGVVGYGYGWGLIYMNLCSNLMITDWMTAVLPPGGLCQLSLWVRWRLFCWRNKTSVSMSVNRHGAISPQWRSTSWYVPSLELYCREAQNLNDSGHKLQVTQSASLFIWARWLLTEFWSPYAVNDRCTQPGKLTCSQTVTGCCSAIIVEVAQCQTHYSEKKKGKVWNL